MKKEKSVQILRDLLTQTDSLFDSYYASGFNRWKRNLEVAIKKIFDEKLYVSRLDSIWETHITDINTDTNFHNKRYIERLESTKELIQSFIDEVVQYGDEEEKTPLRKDYIEFVATLLKELLSNSPPTSIIKLSDLQFRLPQDITLEEIDEGVAHLTKKYYIEHTTDGENKPIFLRGPMFSKWGNDLNGLNLEDKYLASDKKRKVFVVHGRNSKAKNAVFTFLRSLDLKPIEWDEALASTGSATPDIPRTIETAFQSAQAIIILFTGDDLVKLRSDFHGVDEPSIEKELTPQPRPNVIFEAGRAFATHPNRTIVIELGKLKTFSDLSGLHVLRLDDTPEKRQSFISRLKAADCKLNDSGSDWITSGNFKAAHDLKDHGLEHPTDPNSEFVRNGTPICPMCSKKNGHPYYLSKLPLDSHKIEGANHICTSCKYTYQHDE